MKQKSALPKNSKLSAREIKKQINLKTNFTLYFQIGLIASMLAAFFILEIDIKVAKTASASENSFDIIDPPFFDYVIETPKEEVKPESPQKTKTEPKTRKKVTQVASTTLQAVPDDTEALESAITSIEEEPKSTITTATNPAPPKTKHNVVSVEHVPVYPGCEGMVTKQEKIECLSSKISAFIGRKFNTEKFNHLEKDRVQLIQCSFTINENGEVTLVKTKAAHADLEKEAQRVLEKLPLMQAGRQGNTAVPVTYYIPIKFKTN